MHPCFSILALCAANALAQQPTTSLALRPDSNTATATLLAGRITAGLAGSVVSANPCATTYAFACTDTAVCDSHTWTYSLTKGLSTYQLQYSSSALGTVGTAYEECSMHGSCYAVCTETQELSYDGMRTAVVTTVTASGSQLSYGLFPITSGAEKLAQATGVCAAGDEALGVAGRETVEVLKVIILPVVAAVAAGMVA
ncbi:hypothetical protein LTR91_021561 [Friedmanniomyces endolithicus]|uniref:Uncharacterized protein n=2 Tax=Dothideomycetidae TaxID=451867 RepID=A0AAN6H777_9PEZI|nr:hypothetical protein LTR94_018282 [Friedmanniomyces endolithicus]KAK5146739.1 hypothetical protein LTR32_001721 [Rachicladosporium monterosium]KAK0776815.1 hypothetical protein LTR38_015380 [Friedmanniomyces endolithicus]KAK0787043.1 hypothetical protein LTR59_010492 [Friedmanniomyces endolithicus]KAK0801240.1 hypothetical protein LTR75_008629 [Friedmanniomyces endolithicus]